MTLQQIEGVVWWIGFPFLIVGAWIEWSSGAALVAFGASLMVHGWVKFVGRMPWNRLR